MDNFGTHPQGGDVRRLTLRSDRLAVDILTLGARLNGLSLDGSPSLVPVASSVDDALGPLLHAGPVIGPVINRIAGATTRIDGRTLSFEANQDGRHLLHSGAVGTQRRLWQVVDEDDASATLAIDLPEGEGGFSGNRRILARWHVAGAVLALDIEAETDAPTLMNPGHHPYFNLDCTSDWSGHRLEVAADRYLPVDNDTLPTGEIAPVTGDRDLRAARTPPPDIDNNYCLTITGATPAVAARLIGASGRRLDLLTDAPGLQVFTGKPHAIALEAQGWPDAPNHDNFPSITLRPGETFRQTTIYRFHAAEVREPRP